MKFELNLKEIPGTKRVEFNCIRCGIHKESYRNKSSAGLKYCTRKCAAADRNEVINNKRKAEADKLVAHKVTAKTNSKAFSRHLAGNCIGCKKSFIRYVAPGEKPPTWCSKKCYDNRKHTIAGREWFCLNCKNRFMRTHHKDDPVPKYCSVACKNKHVTNTGKILKQKFYPNEPFLNKRECFIIATTLVNLCMAAYFLLYVGNARAMDIEKPYIVERICRSPGIYNLRAFSTYEKAAEVMGTTYDVIEKISMHKVENQTHIENVAHYQFNANEFERSRMILTFEMLRLAQRKLQLWFDFERD